MPLCVYEQKQDSVAAATNGDDILWNWVVSGAVCPFSVRECQNELTCLVGAWLIHPEITHSLRINTARSLGI